VRACVIECEMNYCCHSINFCIQLKLISSGTRLFIPQEVKVVKGKTSLHCSPSGTPGVQTDDQHLVWVITCWPGFTDKA